MSKFFDQEEVLRIYSKCERHDEAVDIAERLIKTGKMSIEEIAACVPTLSLDELRQMEADIMQLA